MSNILTRVRESKILVNGIQVDRVRIFSQFSQSEYGKYQVIQYDGDNIRIMYYIYVLGIVDGNNTEVQMRIKQLESKIRSYRSLDYISINKFLYETGTWILEGDSNTLQSFETFEFKVGQYITALICNQQQIIIYQLLYGSPKDKIRIGDMMNSNKQSTIQSDLLYDNPGTLYYQKHNQDGI